MKAKGIIILAAVTVIVGTSVFFAIKKINPGGLETLKKSEDGKVETESGKVLVPKGGVISTKNLEEVISGIYQVPVINIEASINNMLSAPTTKDVKSKYFTNLRIAGYITTTREQELISKL